MMNKINKPYKKYEKKEPKIFDEKRLFSYCIWLLSKRDYSSYELIEKMKKYQPDILLITNTINKLIEYAYIDDQKRAQNIFNQYIKKEGTKKIAMRLSQKGIPKEIIKSITDNYKETVIEDELISPCYDLLVKKFKQYDYENYKKYCSFLASKGFSWDDISKSITQFKLTIS